MNLRSVSTQRVASTETKSRSEAGTRWTRWLALAWIVLSFDQNIPTFINVGALNPWNSPFSLSIYRLVLTLQYSDQVAICLDAPNCLPELPAAVEVAVYRITQEALTNVVRHAHTHRCDLRLTLDEATGLLTLSIQDDGCGLSPSLGVGVGLVSMRERAEELGGTWTIEQVPTGGTRVLVRLPYARSQTADAAFVTPGVVTQGEE